MRICWLNLTGSKVSNVLNPGPIPGGKGLGGKGNLTGALFVPFWRMCVGFSGGFLNSLLVPGVNWDWIGLKLTVCLAVGSRCLLEFAENHGVGGRAGCVASDWLIISLLM